MVQLDSSSRAFGLTTKELILLTQMCDMDILSVCVDFGKEGVHQIQPIVIQFPVKFKYGTAE